MDLPATPSTEDAQLVLKLYDLRREPLMRESRSALLRWIPRSFGDLRAIVDFIRPSVEALLQSTPHADPRELMFAAVRANVRTSVDHLRHGSAIMVRGEVSSFSMAEGGDPKALQYGYAPS